MPSTAIGEELKEALCLCFTPPCDKAFRYDLKPHVADRLIIFALSAIYCQLEKMDDGGTATAPVPVSKNVVEAGVVGDAASPTPRRVSVSNNGENDIILLEGGTPGFNGQDTFTYDFGIILVPGGVYESPTPHTGAVNLRTRPGEEARATVTRY